jgi:hypothetical protein
MKRDDGGQAFPGTGNCMTLRDYFAGQAIAGFLASDVILLPDNLALEAYEIADAMLRARKEAL